MAAIFNFHSIDFLLQYSFHHAENPQIQSQIHHFGDIIKTLAIKTHHNITKAITSTVFITQQKNNKKLSKVEYKYCKQKCKLKNLI